LEFYEQVHEIVRMVPRGRVTTYDLNGILLSINILIEINV